MPIQDSTNKVTPPTNPPQPGLVLGARKLKLPKGCAAEGLHFSITTPSLAILAIVAIVAVLALT